MSIHWHLSLCTGEATKAKIGQNLKELADDADIVFLQERGPWDQAIPEDPARQGRWCRVAGTRHMVLIVQLPDEG